MGIYNVTVFKLSGITRDPARSFWAVLWGSAGHGEVETCLFFLCYINSLPFQMELSSKVIWGILSKFRVYT
jgi:hypothetical protein